MRTISRRGFVKGIASASAIAVVPASASVTKDKQIKAKARTVTNEIGFRGGRKISYS